MATTEKSSKKNTESGQVFNRAISLRRRIASPQRFERALDEIRTLETLREGWDSYNAPAIAPEVRSRACAFMTMLATHLGSRVSLPVIGPTPAGGVMLRWDDSNREVEVTFLRTGGEYSIVDGETGEVVQEGDVGRPEGVLRAIQPYIRSS